MVNASFLGISNVLKFKSCACVYSIINRDVVNTFRDVSGWDDKKGHVNSHILKVLQDYHRVNDGCNGKGLYQLRP